MLFYMQNNICVSVVQLMLLEAYMGPLTRPEGHCFSFSLSLHDTYLYVFSLALALSTIINTVEQNLSQRLIRYICSRGQ